MWTKHSEYKLTQYALSKQRVRRVVRHPDRMEKSIVPGMVACMQIAGTSKNRQEIWVMYEVKSQIPNLKTHNSQLTSPDTKRIGTDFDKGSGLEKLRDAGFKFRDLSPAQKFRLQRQQEFSARLGALGGEGKILRIISVWRYPGTSSERDPIPSEILEEIRNMVG